MFLFKNEMIFQVLRPPAHGYADQLLPAFPVSYQHSCQLSIFKKEDWAHVPIKKVNAIFGMLKSLTMSRFPTDSSDNFNHVEFYLVEFLTRFK